MLTPNQLQEIPVYFVNLFQELENFIIEDIARRISKVGNITDMAEWQLMRAEEIGIADKTIKKKISEILGISFDAIEKLFEESAIKSIESDNILYEHAKLTPIHLSGSEELKSYVDSAKEQTKGKLKNMTGTLGFCTIKKGNVISKKLTEIYRESLDLAQFQVSTGVLDYNTAVKKAVKRLADSGLRFIDYETGWANRIDVATRRAVLTGVNQMSQNINNRVINDIETDIVEVTAHSGARSEGAGIKNHKKWQGKWYSLSGKSTKYPSLKNVTGWGQGDGLGGWNCSHQFHAIIPGISIPSYSEKQLKNIDPPDIGYKGRTYTHYQALQYQRKIETAMRQTKRQLIAYESAGLKDEFTSASIKLQMQKQEYKEFSKVAKLKLQNERHQTLGYNKSISQKSVHANKKEDEKYKKYHYNKNNTIVVTDDFKNEDHYSVKKEFKPFAVVETKETKKGVKQINRTYYDKNGMMVKQVHTGAHGNKKQHPYKNEGAHKHIYEWDENKKPQNRTTSELDEDDIIENKDILKMEVRK